jgi:hypothetical protein
MIADLLTRTVTIRQRTAAGVDAHGTPTMIETTVIVRGHVQPNTGDNRNAEGSGSIDTRRAVLFTLPSTVTAVGDIVDDGTDEWTVTAAPRTHTRPRSSGGHHLSVDLAWSAPSTPTPTNPPDDEWISHDW